MTSIDLIIGTVYFSLFVLLGVLTRDYFSQSGTRRFFVPALTLKMSCGVLLGLLYFYYYGGGDTVGYFWSSSRIWNLFLENPIAALRVILWNGEYGNGMYKYLSTIPHHLDLPSFFVVRLAGLFGILSLNTYTGIAIYFSLLSFAASWALFQALVKVYPHLKRQLAIAVLFIPSVLFWGSGILKDTVTYSAVCMMTWAIVNVFYLKKNRIASYLVFGLCFFVVYHVKVYILLCYIPATAFWLHSLYMDRIRSNFVKWSVRPILIALSGYLGYLAINFIVLDDPRYSLDRIAETAAITAYDIRYWTGKDAGSGYDLGGIEDSFQGMLSKAPSAINVALFRPYPWEVSNPLMAIMSLESTLLLIITFIVVIRSRKSLQVVLQDSYVQFALVFALSFAFAVGISTYNFGTLIRYKIPMLPFLVSALFIMWFYKKDSQLAVKENQR